MQGSGQKKRVAGKHVSKEQGWHEGEEEPREGHDRKDPLPACEAVIVKGAQEIKYKWAHKGKEVDEEKLDRLFFY
jgi:hypothetical protein